VTTAGLPSSGYDAATFAKAALGFVKAGGTRASSASTSRRPA
jgi:hypothetical protein